MGFGLPEIAIVLLIVLVIFGSKKIKTLGSDLGEAIKGFRSSMSSEPAESEPTVSPDPVEKKTEAND